MDVTVVMATIPPRTGPGGPFQRAVASVQAQTYPAAGGILVELDGDRTGPAATRNRALARVETEWVAFCDDDDEWYPNHLHRLTRYARLTGVDVAYPGYDCVGGDDLVNMFGVPFDAGLLRRRNYIPITVLARTELVRAAGGFQPHPDEHGDPCEDWGLWLSMLDTGARFGHLPVRTWRWNLGPGCTRGRTDRW